MAITVIASISEIISIGSVLPFLAVLTDPNKVFSHPEAQPLIVHLNFTEPRQLVLPLSIFFGIAALFAGCARLLLLRSSIRLASAVGSDLSIEIYRRTLYQPYSIHLNQNSSKVINTIIHQSSSIINKTVLPVLTIINSIVMLGAIFLLLLTVDPGTTLGAFGSFLVCYLVVIKATRKRLLLNGEIASRQATLVIKSLQEGLGGIREILIDGTQPLYCTYYQQADRAMRHAEAGSLFIGQCPRYVMESLGLVVIAIISYFLSKSPGGVADSIPILGAIAIGAQRMLPVMQQAYVALTGIFAGQSTLKDVLELLDGPNYSEFDTDRGMPITFEKDIRLRQLGFKYSPDSPMVFYGLELKFNKGDRIGIIGVTGSGKTTLIDLIIGLLHPNHGSIEIDSVPLTETNRRGWQALIAHVPQSIFLADCSIEENIAFGVPREMIDFERVRRAATQAQIEEVILSLPQQYATRVGERGIRLSGGQRQRIGIARALYKRASVLIFDEATSALDGGTEMAVMQAIDGLGSNLTVILIAHRLSTLKGCNRVVELGVNGVARVGTYTEMLGR